MKLIYLVLTFRLALSIPLGTDSNCGECQSDMCLPFTCDHGTTKDKCGCCDVCVQKEKEPCGGFMNIEGICDQGLFCNPRHLHSTRNSMLPDSQKIGKCEPDLCKSTKCGHHEWCTVIDGKASCYCPFECSDENESPLCGVNGKEYRNHCEVKKEECETQTTIYALPGKCLECIDNDGTTHSQGSKVPTGNNCEYKECQEGTFIQYVDEKCMIEKGHCSKEYDACPPGQFCFFSKKHAKVGQCKELDPNLCYFDNRILQANETFVDSACTGQCRCNGFNQVGCVSLCPPVIAACSPEQTLIHTPIEMSKSPKCFCSMPDCIDTDAVCKRKSHPGPCFAYFGRWYYDDETGRCKKFIYGGCHSNGNNFETKELCENACRRKVVFPFDMGAERKRAFVPNGPPSWSPSISSMPELSKTKMSIKGKVTFDKKMTLPRPSCLIVSLREASRTDVLSALLESVKIDLSYHNTKEDVSYQLDTLKPVDSELWKKYILQSRVHVGWCPEKISPIRKGDFRKPFESHRVKLIKEKNVYVTKDINLKCYHCNTNVKVSKSKNLLAVHKPPKESIRLPVPKEPFTYDEPPQEIIRPLVSYEPFRRVEPNQETRRGPELSEKDMVIKGRVKLPHKHKGALPNHSCLKIILQDITFMDAASVEISSKIIDLSGLDIGSTINYELLSKKPIDSALKFRYSVSSVLNYGWCSIKGESKWIRKGDYLTDTTHGVEFEKEVDEYVMDIQLVCYDCPENRGTKTVEEKEPAVSPVVPPVLVISYDEPNPIPNVEEPQMNSGSDDTNKDNNGSGSEESKEASKKFPFYGTAPGPKLSTTAITINGYVRFPHKVGLLPSPSCLFVKLNENTALDVASNTLSTIKIDVSKFNIDDKLAFVITSLKPEDDELWRTYTLSVVLNFGWCPNNETRDWLRNGDYLDDTLHEIKLKSGTNNYNADVDVIQYSFSDITKGNVEPESAAGPTLSVKTTKTNRPELGNIFMEISGSLLFNESVTSIVSGSCLRLLFQDTTGADGEAYTIKERIIDVSGIDIGKLYPYLLGANKPLETEYHRTFEIAAVLNIGWCPKNINGDDEWIRPGDFKSDFANQISLSPNEDKYNVDIQMKKLPLLKQKCFEQNVAYDHGSTWKEDRCTNCECDNGLKMCSAVDCKPCLKPAVRKEEECCPVCLDDSDLQLPATESPPSPRQVAARTCYDDVLNRTFKSGEHWKRDTCTPCMCHGSSVSCAIVDCVYTMVKPCKNLTYTPGVCCPDCADEKKCFDDKTKKWHPEGETWHRDECETCLCKNNEVVCKAECLAPLKEQTCYDPVSNSTFNSGDSWKPNVCTTCKCDNGEKMCATAACALLPCKNPITKPGKCCPQCSKEQCIDRSRQITHKEGDTWVEKDGCTRCHCIGGRPLCSVPSCVKPECAEGVSIITVDGVCCPVCSNMAICNDVKTNDKFVEGRTWQNDDCEVCKCTPEGSVCERPNTDLEGCSAIVTMKKSCGKICLDPQYEKEVIDP